MARPTPEGSQMMEASTHDGAHGSLTLVLAWLAVGVPLLWGVAQTIHKAMALFGAGA
jgi:hypothetical protein